MINDEADSRERKKEKKKVAYGGGTLVTFLIAYLTHVYFVLEAGWDGLRCRRKKTSDK